MDTPEANVTNVTHDEVQGTVADATKPDIPNFLKKSRGTTTVENDIARRKATEAEGEAQAADLVGMGGLTLRNSEEAMDLANRLSSVGVEADLDQFDDRIEGLTGDIAECDTDLGLCEAQIKGWKQLHERTRDRHRQLSDRRKALRAARRALLDALEDGS